MPQLRRTRSTRPPSTPPRPSSSQSWSSQPLHEELPKSSPIYLGGERFQTTLTYSQSSIPNFESKSDKKPLEYVSSFWNEDEEDLSKRYMEVVYDTYEKIPGKIGSYEHRKSSCLNTGMIHMSNGGETEYICEDDSSLVVYNCLPLGNLNNWWIRFLVLFILRDMNLTYIIYCKVTGKYYYGQSGTPYARISSYPRNEEEPRPIDEDIHRYGKKYFDLSVVVPRKMTTHHMECLEATLIRWALDKYKYNVKHPKKPDITYGISGPKGYLEHLKTNPIDAVEKLRTNYGLFVVEQIKTSDGTIKIRIKNRQGKALTFCNIASAAEEVNLSERHLTILLNRYNFEVFFIRRFQSMMKMFLDPASYSPGDEVKISTERISEGGVAGYAIIIFNKTQQKIVKKYNSIDEAEGDLLCPERWLWYRLAKNKFRPIHLRVTAIMELEESDISIEDDSASQSPATTLVSFQTQMIRATLTARSTKLDKEFISPGDLIAIFCAEQGHSMPIVFWNMTKDKVKEWPSTNQAAKALGCNGNYISDKAKTFTNMQCFFWVTPEMELAEFIEFTNVKSVLHILETHYGKPGKAFKRPKLYEKKGQYSPGDIIEFTKGKGRKINVFNRTTAKNAKYESQNHASGVLPIKNGDITKRFDENEGKDKFVMIFTNEMKLRDVIEVTYVCGVPEPSTSGLQGQLAPSVSRPGSQSRDHADVREHSQRPSDDIYDFLGLSNSQLDNIFTYKNLDLPNIDVHSLNINPNWAALNDTALEFQQDPGLILEAGGESTLDTADRGSTTEVFDVFGLHGISIEQTHSTSLTSSIPATGTSSDVRPNSTTGAETSHSHEVSIQDVPLSSTIPATGTSSDVRPNSTTGAETSHSHEVSIQDVPLSSTIPATGTSSDVRPNSTTGAGAERGARARTRAAGRPGTGVGADAEPDLLFPSDTSGGYPADGSCPRLQPEQSYYLYIATRRRGGSKPAMIVNATTLVGCVYAQVAEVNAILRISKNRYKALVESQKHTSTGRFIISSDAINKARDPNVDTIQEMPERTAFYLTMDPHTLGELFHEGKLYYLLDPPPQSPSPTPSTMGLPLHPGGSGSGQMLTQGPPPTTQRPPPTTTGLPLHPGGSGSGQMLTQGPPPTTQRPPPTTTGLPLHPGVSASGQMLPQGSPPGAMWMPPQGAMWMPPATIGPPPPPGAMWMPPQGAMWMPSQGAMWMPPQGAMWMPPQGAMWMPPPGAPLHPGASGNGQILTQGQPPAAITEPPLHPGATGPSPPGTTHHPGSSTCGQRSISILDQTLQLLTESVSDSRQVTGGDRIAIVIGPKIMIINIRKKVYKIFPSPEDARMELGISEDIFNALIRQITADKPLLMWSSTIGDLRVRSNMETGMEPKAPGILFSIDWKTLAADYALRGVLPPVTPSIYSV